MYELILHDPVLNLVSEPDHFGETGHPACGAKNETCISKV